MLLLHIFVRSLRCSNKSLLTFASSSSSLLPLHLVLGGRHGNNLGRHLDSHRHWPHLALPRRLLRQIGHHLGSNLGRPLPHVDLSRPLSAVRHIYFPLNLVLGRCVGRPLRQNAYQDSRTSSCRGVSPHIAPLRHLHRPIGDRLDGNSGLHFLIRTSLWRLSIA